jgi:hypothetical protein
MMNYIKSSWNLSKKSYLKCLDVLWSPIRIDDQKGYVYCFTTNKFIHKNCYKIGRSIDVSRRLIEWSKQCRYTTKLICKIESKHSYKAESFLHAYYVDYWHKFDPCDGCGRRHVEWFKLVDEKDIESDMKTICSFTSQIYGIVMN